MSNTFKNRVFGCVVIKSVNSNYNEIGRAHV